MFLNASQMKIFMSRLDSPFLTEPIVNLICNKKLFVIYNWLN